MRCTMRQLTTVHTCINARRIRRRGYKAGASPDAGVVLSRYGHRLGPNSAHINPETGVITQCITGLSLLSLIQKHF